MLRFRAAMKALHARKDRAYGRAWKKRGERISVVPNIARKVDRLAVYAQDAVPMADESLLDTAIDLYIYSIKYVLFLAESSRELAEQIALGKAPSPLSDHEGNFDKVIDAGRHEIADHVPSKELIARVTSAFEEVWPAAENCTDVGERFRLASVLANLAEMLLMQVAHEHPRLVDAFVDKELSN